MREEDLRFALSQMGTPQYLFDLDVLEETVNSFRRALGEETGLCFAVKANPFVVREMARLVDRIEVCSMGEYQICRRCEVPPEKLLISGVLKKEKDLRKILAECEDRCMYTAESLDQFRILEQWSRTSGVTLRVFPRLCSGSQFGLDPEELEKLIADRAEYPYIHIQGLHYFSGTQKKNIGKIGKEMELLDTFLAKLEGRYGFRPEELEYGPGLWVDYFGTGKSDPQTEREELGQLTRNMAFSGKVTLEMGRALAAYCGTYLTGIEDVKCNKGRNYAIVDGGLHQFNYDGQIRGMYLPKVQIIRKEKTDMQMPAEDWTICGSLCTTNDVLLQQLQTQKLYVGDVLAFEQVGAYSVMEGMAVFLSHELPAVVSYSSSEGWKLLREEQETFPLNTPNC